MSRRRWIYALVLLGACNADVRFDPSFSCTGSTRPSEAPSEPDASLAGTCRDASCSPFAVSAGAQHTCASIAHGSENGSTICWGRNDAHQVSTSEEASVVRPERVPFGFATSVASSGAHTCAVESPWLACWGSNAAGLLGWPAVDATYAEQAPFTQAGAPLIVTTGAAHTCTLDDDGQVRCFGDNAFGQLGAVADPYLVQRGTWLTLPSEIRAIDAGGLRTCAWDDAGAQLLCWGHDDVAHDEVPWVVPGVSGVDEGALSVGPSHACVITGGDVRCWGNNAHGELGAPGERVPLPGPARQISAGGWLPIEITGPTEIEYAAPSPAHTCALLESGEVWCWGANARGQLGDGTTASRATPVRVPLDARARSVSAGGAHTCAITADAVVCWGDNQHGQLAVDTALPFSAEPLRVTF